MMQQQIASKQLEPIPDELSSPQAKLVYLYIDAVGGATVDDLNEGLAMKKISVLSILSSLTGEGIVEKDETRYVTTN